MNQVILNPEIIQSNFEALLNREIERLGIQGIQEKEYQYNNIRGTYEDYLSKGQPNGGPENVDETIKHVARIDNLGRFAVSLEETNSKLIGILSNNGVEDLLPEDLVLPNNKAYRVGTEWKTLQNELKGLYKSLGVWVGDDNPHISEPSVSQITPYLEGILKVNKTAAITFRRIGLNDEAKHFSERATFFEMVYDQRLAFEGKPVQKVEIQDRYDGNNSIKSLASEQTRIVKLHSESTIDAYLIMTGDDVFPTSTPGFKRAKDRQLDWDSKRYILGERTHENIKLMADRVQGDHKIFGSDRRPWGYGNGPYYNAVGEIGFTKRDDMLMAMYMHFSGDLAKEFTNKHPNGVTYLTWLFEPNFEPTGNLTSEQMLNSDIVRIPSYFVAGETDKSKIFDGLNSFVLGMMRMTGVTHKMYEKQDLRVFPTLYSDLTIDSHMADLVLNYKPKK